MARKGPLGALAPRKAMLRRLIFPFQTVWGSSSIFPITLQLFGEISTNGLLIDPFCTQANIFRHLYFVESDGH